MLNILQVYSRNDADGDEDGDNDDYNKPDTSPKVSKLINGEAKFWTQVAGLCGLILS